MADALTVLRAFVAGYPSARQAAHSLGISPQYLSLMLRSTRPITPRVLTQLGLEQRTRIVQKGRSA